MISYTLNAVEPNCEQAKICMGIWNRRQSGEYSYAQAEKELAYVSIAYGLEHLAHKVERMVMPEALKQLMELPKECRITDPSFWKREDITAYLEYKQKAKWDNVFNYERLLELRAIFAKNNDPVSVMKVSGVLRTYPRSFYQNNRPNGQRRENETTQAGYESGRNADPGEVSSQRTYAGENGRVSREAESVAER